MAEQPSIEQIRHTAAHVMAEAVLQSGGQVRHRPAIENGFYYDFDLPRPLTPDDLEAITALMKPASARKPLVRRR